MPREQASLKLYRILANIIFLLQRTWVSHVPSVAMDTAAVPRTLSVVVIMVLQEAMDIVKVHTHTVAHIVAHSTGTDIVKDVRTYILLRPCIEV